MRALVGIVLGAILVTAASACFVYSPPSYAQQDLAYVNFESLRAASDRIVSGRFVELADELSEDGTKLRYLSFKVTKSYKGSADEGDHVAILELSEPMFAYFDGSPVELKVGADYALFLKGRARPNEYPAKYGGTVWSLNGDPALATITTSGDLDFAYRVGFVRNRAPVEFKFNLNALTAKSSAPLEPHLFYAI